MWKPSGRHQSWNLKNPEGLTCLTSPLQGRAKVGQKRLARTCSALLGEGRQKGGEMQARSNWLGDGEIKPSLEVSNVADDTKARGSSDFRGSLSPDLAITSARCLLCLHRADGMRVLVSLSGNKKSWCATLFVDATHIGVAGLAERVSPWYQSSSGSDLRGEVGVEWEETALRWVGAVLGGQRKGKRRLTWEGLRKRKKTFSEGSGRKIEEGRLNRKPRPNLENSFARKGDLQRSL